MNVVEGLQGFLKGVEKITLARRLGYVERRAGGQRLNHKFSFKKPPPFLHHRAPPLASSRANGHFFQDRPRVRWCQLFHLATLPIHRPA